MASVDSSTCTRTPVGVAASRTRKALDGHGSRHRTVSVVSQRAVRGARVPAARAGTVPSNTVTTSAPASPPAAGLPSPHPVPAITIDATADHRTHNPHRIVRETIPPARPVHGRSAVRPRAETDRTRPK
jgi:hypothetical protein